MSEKDALTTSHPVSKPEAPGRRWSPRRVRLAGYSVGVLLAIGLAALVFWLVTASRGDPAATSTGDTSAAVSSEPAATGASADAKGAAAWQRPVVSAAGLADSSGVQIVYVAVSGGGGLVDLRYRVVDSDKAAALHDEARPPVIVDETSGIVIDQLLMGHYHTGKLNAGQIYYLIFENSGNLVQRGDKVSVLLGNAEVDHVAVQ